MGKRGQITSFIIIGILLLFSVGLLIYASQIIPGFRIFTQEETPIQQYIGTCLEQTAKEGIIRLGTRGGYLEVPEHININERSYFSFAPRIEPKIPLWYYRGQPRIPTKSSMEGNLSRYIVENINPCLADFDAFKDQFEIKSRGNVTAETLISDTAVTVKLNYPLEVTDKQSNTISRLDFVTRTSNVKLGKMYAMAIDILRSENQKEFFENVTMEMLSATSEFPITGMEFGCVPQTWKKSEIIDIAKQLIAAETRKVTVVGNPSRLFDNNNLYERNHYIFPLSKQYTDIRVVFSYPFSTRFDLTVRPNNREEMRSNVGKPGGIMAVIPFCINQWHFTYDIEYPLLTVLRDEKAFNGDGFIFNFAFPVTINHNEGDKQDFSITTFDVPDLNYQFCSNVNPTQVDVRVRDAFTYEELYQAKVDFQCVLYSCDLGETRSNGGSYRIVTRLPSACDNGLFIAKAEGYIDGVGQYTGGQYAEVLLKPKKIFRVSFDKYEDTNLGKALPLEPGERAVLFISSPSNPEFEEQVYVSDDPVNEIELIDGDGSYTVEILLIREGPPDVLTGGYIGQWDVTYGNLAGASEIVFHLAQKTPIAVTEAEQVEASGYVYGDTNYQAPLRPTFR